MVLNKILKKTRLGIKAPNYAQSTIFIQLNCFFHRASHDSCPLLLSHPPRITVIITDNNTYPSPSVPDP
jgi:hypothetical protein